LTLKEWWFQKSGLGSAERTGIDEPRATTRDIPDYDVLMRQRLRVLRAAAVLAVKKKP